MGWEECSVHCAVCSYVIWVRGVCVSHRYISSSFSFARRSRRAVSAATCLADFAFGTTTNCPWPCIAPTPPSTAIGECLVVVEEGELC